jgi:hypothetical protein
LLIVLKDGERLEGSASSVALDGIAVRTFDGPRTAPYERIQRVKRRDSSKNGVLIGMGVGAAVASLPLVIGNECRYETCGSQLGFPLTGAAVGAALGWGIDRLVKGWTKVFDAGAGQPPASARSDTNCACCFTTNPTARSSSPNVIDPSPAAASHQRARPR